MGNRRGLVARWLPYCALLGVLMVALIALALGLAGLIVAVRNKNDSTTAALRVGDVPSGTIPNPNVPDGITGAALATGGAGEAISAVIAQSLDLRGEIAYQLNPFFNKTGGKGLGLKVRGGGVEVLQGGVAVEGAYMSQESSGVFMAFDALYASLVEDLSASSALEDVLGLRVVSCYYQGKHRVGILGQDLSKNFPDGVRRARNEGGSEDVLYVNFSEVLPKLVVAVQSVMERVSALENEK